METTPWSHLYLLGGEGPRSPLFAVHGAAGGANVYRRLASSLGPARAFYGLRALGLWQGQVPLADMETIVQRYIADMRSVQPRGPYFLLGYSTGGVMAYEIVQRLCLQGDSVAFLGLIDTALPSPKNRDADDIALLAAYFRMDVQQTVERLRDASREQVLEHFAEYASRFEMVPASAAPGRLPRLFDVITTNLRIANRCELEPWAGTLTFFAATSGKHGGFERDRAWGWDKLARDFQLLRLPGNHFSILREPDHVAILAQALSASLELAEMRLEKSGKSDELSVPS